MLSLWGMRGVVRNLLAFFLVAVVLSPTPVWAFTLQSQGLKGWQASVLPIRLNPANCGLTEAELVSLLNEAIDLWNSIPSSSLRLEYGGLSNSLASNFKLSSPASISDSPVLLCSDDFAVDSGLSDGSDPAQVGLIHDTVPALVQTGTVESSLVYAPLLLNSTTNGQASIRFLSRDQVRIVIAHELGHVLGLGHASERASLMYFDTTSKTALALSRDDVDGISYLYPRNEPFAGEFWGCGSIRKIGKAEDTFPPQTGRWGGAFMTLFWILALGLVLKLSGSRPLRDFGRLVWPRRGPYLRT